MTFNNDRPVLVGRIFFQDMENVVKGGSGGAIFFHGPKGIYHHVQTMFIVDKTHMECDQSPS